MNIVCTVDELRAVLQPLRGRATIGLAPTMGALHRGHVALFGHARRTCDVVVATLFVNPAQFGDPADLRAYPRNEAADAETATAAGVDLLFIPQADEIYPAAYATWVDVAGPALGLEGDFRPGHFRGVATICLKLFNIVQPAVAFFGQKDAQQVAVVNQMVRDLNLPMEIRVVPTVRDEDGLAVSSRNAHLSQSDRTRAFAIARALAEGVAAFREGRDPVAAARRALGDITPDYVTVAQLGGHPTLIIAARIGTTRLIDNVPLDAPELGGLEALAAAALSLRGAQ